MAALFFKCLLGALAVLIIALLSKTKSFFISGLVPLFPTFALIAHYIVGTERTMEDSAHYRAVWAVFAYPVCGVSSCGVLL